ncbi:MAG: response regulator [Spirochaetaceae bacterium]|nr:response regulator [Spirochaetaceae bacterium]RKX76264.1 MAG: response regulator [Spirochaetota bacterium]RKX85181.1 MAG: response regulator [Spirochaetota bacterium]RKX95616.1 MAG: response regulator [Spirochaetota bacterium]
MEKESVMGGEHMQSSVAVPRVLVIDDENVVGDLMGFMLKRAGYDVSVVLDGTAGLALCESTPPDLVITDITMPDMDGIEFLRRLRKTGIRIPSISISGNPVGMKFLDAAKLLGAREVLRKPISEKDLLEAVKRSLQESPHD